MSGILMMSVGNSYGYKPVNTVAPAVTGTATVGQTLSCSTGTWDAAPPSITYTYQWQRGTTNISGATSSTYVIQSADAGNTLRCVVTATNAVGATSANSNSTATVAQAPVNTVAPVVSGTAQVGQTLSSTTGTWTGFPASFTYAYQWQRNTSNISGATSSTYVIQSADVGNTLRCVVTATNTAGSTSANSNSTATVTEATGQVAFTTPGSYTWVVPVGVTSISVVSVGAGAGGGFYTGKNGSGGGGALTYANNVAVTPGDSWTVVVPAGSPAATNTSGSDNVGQNAGLNRLGVVIAAAGGGNGTSSNSAGGVSNLGFGFRSGGGNGGSGSAGFSNINYGGGGAGGYTGAGGGFSTFGQGGGGGGGGYGGIVYICCSNWGTIGNLYPGGNGGGVGILGQGSNGAAGANSSSSFGGAGGAGSGGSGQTYGGGGRSGYTLGSPSGCCYVPPIVTNYSGQAGGGGAVRIIWPGTTRQFPSTNTGNL